MIPLFSPYIPPEAGDAVKQVIESGWINTGPKEKQFREQLQQKFGFPHCVATNNCTASLRASLAALGVTRGDEVITTPWTMIATNTAILEQGATPVFADIKYDTLNLDPDSVAQKITPRTKAIMCVHYAGAPCNLDALNKIANDNDLTLVEDAAQALGAKHNGEYIGASGKLVNFSFQAIKTITSGDGGAIATDSEELYEALQTLVWFGIDKKRRQKTALGALPHDVEVLGFKYNMNDITAAMGLVGLNHFDEALQKRRDVARHYMDELQNLNDVTLLNYPKNITPAYWMFPIHVKHRLRFAEYMRCNGVEVSIHYPRNDGYTIFGGKQPLPATERVDADAIHIPIHSNLSEAQVAQVIDAVRRWHGY